MEDFKKNLQLWHDWILAGGSISNKKRKSPHCTCARPDLYWDESPSHPEQYETEYCHSCGNYTDWNRITNGADANGWHREQNIQTGEVRFRNMTKNLLLTAREHNDHIRCQDGSMSDAEIKAICQVLAKKFDTGDALKMIERRLGKTATISKSRLNGQGSCLLVTRTISGKGGAIINF